MAILSAAIVVVGLLCLTDLLLTFGVIRRLREHTERLANSSGMDLHAPVSDLAIGETVAPFTAPSVSGEPLSGPAGLRMVAFFSAGCSACPERVPAFVDYVRANQITRDSIIAVVISSRPEPVSYQEDIAAVAPVLVEPLDGGLADAFKVRGFPTFFLLDGAGSVSAYSHEPVALPALAAARQR
jgi:hypothetical protein